MRKGILTSLGVVTALALAACSSDSSDSSAEESAPETAVGTVVDVAVGAGGFEILVAAVTAADLADTLNSAGPFTVFAPTDEAFAALPEVCIAHTCPNCHSFSQREGFITTYCALSSMRSRSGSDVNKSVRGAKLPPPAASVTLIQ